MLVTTFVTKFQRVYERGKLVVIARNIATRDLYLVNAFRVPLLGLCNNIATTISTCVY